MPNNHRIAFPEKTEKYANRFWSKVEVRAPDECWPWMGSLGTTGYGQFRPSPTTNSMSTHRVAFWFAYGDPMWAWVLHSCDFRPCCNPEHFFLGDRYDNIRDCLAKGRHARGEKQGAAKLTPQVVREIRALYVRGKKSTTNIPCLATKYGVDNALVHRIIMRKSWAHVD